MAEHGTTQPADGTTPVPGAGSAFHRTLLRRALPAVAAAGLGVTGIAGVAHGAAGGAQRTAAAEHSSYTAFEQRGGHGTDHRSLTYGLPGGDAEFMPYRPVAFGD
ncbi:hypothetical protein ACFXO2_08270 [Streptomyces sp. NPDC059152]|uniref:hypothetical protein n=1 Tax=Streptomyces sp. NPDC059152 TaxID=3346742 RepID=UPI0036D084EE